MGAVALLVVAAALAAPASALAHASDAAAALPAPAWRWNLEPWLLVLLAASALLYATGIARLWRQAGTGRGIGTLQAASFAGGWLVLVAALVSPLDGLGAWLFSAHMVQHEALMVVAAPLLVLGRPLAAWTWALPPGARRRVGRATQWPWLAGTWDTITRPLAAWALHAIALWLWHVPQLFDAALHSEGLHILQHASFLGTALLFWWACLGNDVRSQRGAFALGGLLALAPTAWYDSYAATAPAFGLDAVADQQLGGLVMWVPGAVAYLVAGLVLVARVLARPALTPASAAVPGLPR